MKRHSRTRIVSLALFANLIASSLAQGVIRFSNDNLVNPDTGALYRAGIFQSNFNTIWGDSTNGAGAGISVGIFLASDPSQPLKFIDGSPAVVPLRTSNNTEIIARPGTVVVPGVPPGERALLVVRAWTTADGSYQAARTSANSQHGEQLFTSKPLAALGSTAIPDIAPFNGFELRNVHFGPIGDFAFVTQFPTPGTFTATVPMWWRAFNPQNLNGSSDAVGVMNTADTGHFAEGAGPTKIAFLLMNGPAVGEAGIEGEGNQRTLEYNRRATLIYAVGNPASGTSSAGSLNLNGFPGYRVELLAGDTILASDNNTLAANLPEGTFATKTLEFITTDRYHPAIGRALRVRLINLNQPGTPDNPGSAVAFGNVRLLDVPTQPKLAVTRRTSTEITVTWTDWSNDLRLEMKSDLTAPTWTMIPYAGQAYHYAGFDNAFTATITPSNAAAIFRLRSGE